MIKHGDCWESTGGRAGSRECGAPELNQTSERLKNDSVRAHAAGREGVLAEKILMQAGHRQREVLSSTEIRSRKKG